MLILMSIFVYAKQMVRDICDFSPIGYGLSAGSYAQQMTEHIFLVRVSVCIPDIITQAPWK
jgi:hypothetical protein